MKNIKEIADKMFNVDNKKIENIVDFGMRTPEHDNMVLELIDIIKPDDNIDNKIVNNIINLCDIDIIEESEKYIFRGKLPKPEIGESVNLLFIKPPRITTNDYGKDEMFIRCTLFGREKDSYDLLMTTTIFKGILMELKKAKIPVDDDMNCVVNHIFTIAGREWLNAPKQIWKIDDISKKPVAPKTFSVALRIDLEERCAIEEDNGEDNGENIVWKMKIEQPIITHNGYIHGQRQDIVLYSDDIEIVLFIDAKPEIDSVQGIIGQMNIYRECRIIRINTTRKTHIEDTDNYSAHYIVISRNITDKQKRYFSMGSIFLIDIKDIKEGTGILEKYKKMKTLRIKEEYLF